VPISATLAAKLTTTLPVTKRSAIISTSGMPGVGKSGFALSSASAGKFSEQYKPVYIPMDRDPVGDYIKGLLATGRVVQPKTNFKANLKTLGQAAGEKLWTEFNGLNLEVMKEPGLNPIIWDTSSYAWTLCRLAKLGKLEQVKPHHYAQANTPFEALLLAAEEYGKILICIDRMSKEYKMNAKGAEAWTGLYQRGGYSHMGYVANVFLEHYQTEEGEFATRVLQDKINPENNGAELIGLESHFGALCYRIWGEKAGEELTDWMTLD
jgi:hypothetical protein